MVGIAIAVIGASLAVALACVGSGKGVAWWARRLQASCLKIPGKFSSCLILQILPGTQGLYGLVIWFFAMLSWAF